MANEIATVSPVTGLPAAPSFIPDSGAGLEQVGMKDMVLPRLVLCQNNTKARDKQNSEYIKGLEEGLFFNSLTREIIGDKIRVVPLFFYHSRMMFKDMKEGGGLICQAPDGKSCQMNAGGPCLHSEWGIKGEPPECSEFYNYPCLRWTGPNDPNNELVIVSMKTTGLKAGRTLNSLMRIRKKASYAGVYELKAVPDVNKAGNSYYTWEASNYEPNPWVSESLYKEAEKMYKMVSEGLLSGKIQVDLSESDAAFADRDSEV